MTTETDALAPIEPDDAAFDDARIAGRSVAADLLASVAEQVGAQAGAKAVFGEAIDRDGLTIVPVAQMIIGAGAGSGSNAEAGDGSGAGSGALTRPIGHIEISEGSARFVPLRRPWLDGGLMVAAAFSAYLAAKAIRALLRG